MDIERKVGELDFAVRNMREQITALKSHVKILDDKVWALVERLMEARQENKRLRDLLGDEDDQY